MTHASYPNEKMAKYADRVAFAARFPNNVSQDSAWFPLIFTGQRNLTEFWFVYYDTMDRAPPPKNVERVIHEYVDLLQLIWKLRRIDSLSISHTFSRNRPTSLLSLLGRASFGLAKSGAKDQVRLKKVTRIRPPPFAAEMDPLPSRDGDALKPDASAHCRLATCRSVWSGGSTVASGGLSFKGGSYVTVLKSYIS